jgi:D-alanyl-D-alanine carboxypeptidase
MGKENHQLTRGGRRPRPARWVGGLARALAIVLAVVALPAPGPASVNAIGPLPGCELGDVYTVPRGYDDWSITLVDRLLRVEDDYIPPDLVHVSEANIAGGGFLRAVAIDDTREMAEAAAAAGNPIGIWSPYRTFEEQTQIFNGYANQFGFEDAITYSHRPGHSEHQLGLGVDFMTAGGDSPLPGDWGATPAGTWMRENSWKYGWINSYPLGDGGALWNDRACFHYEPWHYRYLGREVALAVHESGLTIREYLWQHYTRVDPVTGEAIPTATPTPSPSPTPSPTPLPTPRPTPTPSPTPTPAPSVSSGGPTGIVSPAVAAAALGGLIVALVWFAARRRRAG